MNYNYIIDKYRIKSFRLFYAVKNKPILIFCSLGCEDALTFL